MRVVLVHPPFRHHKFSENLKVVDEEFILAPPIILAYIAGIIEKSGHKVDIIDAHVHKLSLEDTVKQLKNLNPDLIGFRLDTYTFQDAIYWIKKIKSQLKIPVFVGGINMSLYPNETMSYDEIDFGFIGETLETLPKFLKAFETDRVYTDIPGLFYRNNDILMNNKLSTDILDFNAYPFPARHLLDNTLYNSFVSQEKNFTVMLTSTGCPYKCSFCAIAGLGHYRERSAQNVVDEIEECYHKYNICEFDFFDACFFINKPRCLEIFSEISKRKLDIHWTCRTRVDVVDAELLTAAKKSGLRMIFWGIESASSNILDNINKGISIDQTLKSIKMSRKIGIRNLGFLMLGNPGETQKDIKATMKFAKKLKLDYVQICRAIPKPGSSLNNVLIEETSCDYWRDLVSGVEEERRIYVPGVILSQEKIETLLKRAYYGFYFRPGFIIHTLIHIRSINEFIRYFKVAVRMLFHFFYTDVKITKSSAIIKRLAHRGNISEKNKL